MLHADRGPRGIFHTPTDASAAPAAGLVGPLGSSSFSLPTIKRALAELDGSSTLCGLGRHTDAPTSSILGSAPSLTQREVLHNFFKSLLNPKDRAVGLGSETATMAAASGKPLVTGPSAGGGASASASGGPQTDPDAGSGTEDG
jgi:dynein light intermediate chain 1